MSMYGKYPGFPRPKTDFSKDKGKTVQSDRDDAEINKIIKRFLKNGVVRLTNKQPFYGDVSMFDGLADALIKVQNANELFMDFPADIRERFDNDPVKLIDFLDNPENKAEAEELGIIDKEPPSEAQPPVVPTGG